MVLEKRSSSRRRTPLILCLPRAVNKRDHSKSSASDNNGTVPRKRLRAGPSTVNIECVPSEVLFNIFGYLSHRELFYNVRPVNRRWREIAMAPVLWKTLEIMNEVPTGVVLRWLKAAKLLTKFTASNRNDVNVIIEAVSQNCKKLEEINIKNCWGSTKNMIVHSNPLCHLISRCPNLYNYNFSKTKFISCKFFRLISRDMSNGRFMKRCNYIGPMTPKQMEALFSALRDYEVHETATIGNVSLKQKYKLRDLMQYVQEDMSVQQGQVVNEIWRNLIIGLDEVDEV